MLARSITSSSIDLSIFRRSHLAQLEPSGFEVTGRHLRVYAGAEYLTGITSGSMALPPDACSLIVKYVADSKLTLLSLCTVSRQFQSAAERALYNTLDLRGHDYTFAVCDVLSRTPRLAILVIALSLYGQEEDRDDEDFDPPPEYWEVLHQALRRTTRLRFLNLYLDSGGQAAQAWILDGCTFKLRTFHCDLAWDQHLASFLSTQNRLCDLFLADFREPEGPSAPEEGVTPDAHLPALSPAVLTKLSVLDSAFSEAVLALVPNRPVVRVKTCFTHSRLEEKREELRAIVDALRRSKKRLRALDIADSSYTPEFSLELLTTLTADAFFCGDLRYLGTLVLPVDGRKVGQDLLLLRYLWNIAVLIGTVSV